MAHIFAVQFQPRFKFEGWKFGCCEGLGSLGWVLPPPSNSLLYIYITISLFRV